MTKIETFADQEINEYLNLLRMLTNYFNKGEEPPIDLLRKVLSKEAVQNFNNLAKKEESYGVSDLGKVVTIIEKRIFNQTKRKKKRMKISDKPYNIHRYNSDRIRIVESIYGIKPEKSMWLKYLKWFSSGRNFGDFARGTMIVKSRNSPSLPKGVPKMTFADMGLMSNEEKDEYKKKYHHLWTKHEKKYGDKDIGIAEKVTSNIENIKDPFEITKLGGVLHLKKGDSYVTASNQKQVSLIDRTIGKVREATTIDSIIMRWEYVDDAKEFVEDIRNKHITTTIDAVVNSPEAFYYRKKGSSFMVSRNRDLVVFAKSNRETKKKRKEIIKLLDRTIDKNFRHLYKWKETEDAENYMNRVRANVDVKKDKKADYYDELITFKRGNSEHILIRKDNKVYEVRDKKICVNEVLKRFNERIKGGKKYPHKVEQLKMGQCEVSTGNILVDDKTNLETREHLGELKIEKNKGLISDNYFRHPIGDRKYSASINMDVVINKRKLEMKIMTPSSFYQAFIGNPCWRNYYNRKNEAEEFGKVYDIFKVFQTDDKQSREEIFEDIELKKIEAEIELYSDLIKRDIKTGEELEFCLSEPLKMYTGLSDEDKEKMNGISQTILDLPKAYLDRRGLDSIEDLDILKSVEGKIGDIEISKHYETLMHSERLRKQVEYTKRFLDHKFKGGIINKVAAYGLKALINNYETVHGIEKLKQADIMSSKDLEEINKNFTKMELVDEIADSIERDDLDLFNKGVAYFVSKKGSPKNKGAAWKGYYVIESVPNGLNINTVLKKKLELYETGKQFKKELRDKGFTNNEVRFVNQRSNALIRALKVNTRLYKNLPTA